jgi:ABC-type multidrug transport system permease subunit
MQNLILNSTQLLLKEVLSSYKVDPALADPPVIVENPIYGTKVQRFLNFAAPGMMISIIFFLAIGLTALIFVVEKKEGLLERSWIAGVTTVEVMLAHIIVKFFIQFIQIILMVVFADVIFQVCFYLNKKKKKKILSSGKNRGTSYISNGINFYSRYLWNELW